MGIKGKKIIAALLSAAMVATMAAGCNSNGSQTPASTPAAESTASSAVSSEAAAPAGDPGSFEFKASKPETFSLLFNDNPGYPESKDWELWKAITDATNVTLDVTVVPMASFNDKRSVLIASGDAPEIVPKTYPGQEVPFVPSGQILAVSDYVDQMPNYSSEVKAWNLQSDINTLLQKDGKYYVLPELHESFVQDYSLAIRSDILKKNNITVPDSWDDLEAVLKQLKQLYPDVTPFSDRWQLGSTLNFAGPAFCKTATGLKTSGGVDWNSGSTFYYDKDKDEFIFYPTMDEYKTELAYFNKLVNEGLLDKESATQTDDQGKNKFINGKSFVISTNSQEMNDIRTKMDASLGKGNYEVTKINIPSGPAGGNLVGTRLENGILLTAKAKDDPNFNDLLKFVDWLWYSKSGETLCKWGVEGETYTVADGKYKLDDSLTCPAYGLNPENTSGKDLRKDLGFGCGVFTLTAGGPNELAFSMMSDEDKAFVENVNKTRTLLPVAPTIMYDEDQQESQNLIREPLMDYVYQMTYKFILGQASLDNDWDDYVAQCKTKGSDTYTSVANDTYKSSKTAQ